jgi:microcin C transport system substrate-binding protein
VKRRAADLFEILLPSAQFERIVLPYKSNLEKIGIAVGVRTVDTAQYRAAWTPSTST